MFERENYWIRKIQREGHEGSSNKLIHMYYNEIYAFAYMTVHQKQLALDLTQEIFIRMLKSIHHYDKQKATFRTWLYTIAHYHCVDYFRSSTFKQQSMTTTLVEEQLYSSQNIEGEFIHNERVNEIYNVLSTFEPHERMIVLGKLIHDLTFIELAELLKLPLSTVKTKYYKTIRKVKNILE